MHAQGSKGFIDDEEQLLIEEQQLIDDNKKGSYTTKMFLRRISAVILLIGVLLLALFNKPSKSRNVSKNTQLYDVPNLDEKSAIERSVFKIPDSNRDDVISKEEFDVFKRTSNDIPGIAALNFAELDADNDGFVTFGDWQVFLSKTANNEILEAVYGVSKFL